MLSSRRISSIWSVSYTHLDVYKRQGVVTINLPRIAYLAKDEKDFYAKLDHMMDVSARSLKIKRTVITKLMNEGLYPYTRRYLGTFDNHFSTIGLVGMNEACLNAKWLHCLLYTSRLNVGGAVGILGMVQRIAVLRGKNHSAVVTALVG